MNKRYIGDGVYVETDGENLVLTTEDGYRATNTIVLEPEVLVALQRYIAHWQTALVGGEEKS